MRRDVISVCPVCQHELTITRLHCDECDTTLEGTFSVGRFGRLDRDQLVLLESFLRSRGNLREMERELRLSYPTIRGRLESLVRALGLTVEEEVGARHDAGPSDARGRDVPGRRDVLERVARGEMTAEEAAAVLRTMGRGE